MDLNHICLNCMTGNLKGSVCHFCGFDNQSHQEKGLLPHKKILAERYLVGHLLRKDGDSVTYMGYDMQNETPIHIKEFFPAKIARRIPESFNIAPKREAAELYKQELTAFINLSRSLSTMKNLSCIFAVYDVFKANGTAYAISQHAMAMTFDEYLAANDGTLSYEKLVDIFTPFMEGLSLVHAAGLCHYGISPETIYMCDNGKLRLDGFSIKQSKMANSSIYVPKIADGYAPIEQYDYDEFAVGEASDVYSLAAVIFRALTGKAPAKATERINNPRLAVPSKLASVIPAYSLSALANALSPEVGSRTPLIDDFKNDFLNIIPEEVAPLAPSAMQDESFGDEDDYYEPMPRVNRQRGISSNAIAAIVAVVAFVVFLGIGFLIYSLTDHSDKETVEETTATTETTTSDGIQPGESFLENLIGEEFNMDKLKEAYPNLVFQQAEDEFSDKYEAGLICAQEPAGNQTLANGATVKITVSKGQSTIKIPKNLIGLTFEEATAKLKEAGYENVKKLDSYDGSTAIGNVVMVDPAEGTNYDPKNIVVLHVNVLDPNA